MRRSLLALGVLATLGGAFAACRAPTQITVVVTTDVPCAQVGGTQVAVGRLGGDGGIEDRPATATKGVCDSEGNVGSVVIVPSGSKDEELAFMVVLGVGHSPERCTAMNADGCIIARRALHFIPHDSLTVPVAMRASCVGIPCSPDTTCVAGKCVSAKVPDPASCEGAGCPETVLPPVDGGAADSGSSDGGSRDGGDGASPFVAACGDMSGLQAGAAWPMDGYCPGNRRRSPFTGPQKTPQPRILWKSPPHPGDPDLAPLIAADGTVYRVADDGIYAYEPSAGTETKRFAAPEALTNGAALGVDGTIYVPGASRVFAVAPDGGSKSVTFVGRGSVVIGAGPVVLTTGPNMDLSAFNADLSPKWSFLTSASVDFATPAIAPDGKIYLASDDGAFFAIRSSDGGGAPLMNIGAGIHSIAVAPDGLFRVSSDVTHSMRAVTSIGAISWSSPAADAALQGAIEAFAVGDDSTVYVPHGSLEIVALLADGGVKWSTSDSPGCFAITLGADGLLYAGCGADVRAYSSVDGTVVWIVPMIAGKASASIGANHVLYVNASDGVLYAIGN